ncbi:hypothetical protein SDRG_15285 [Saprolegnia diclina VS20]|uniref:Ferric oxidoreductase domain-containing protein n=1 Tax=Saprolegnia diclina (strain VS20) TaxID=1156394 RepID=T0PNJ0_SAPDV|nr:hypothetical protein SDRG_15285 [Saprolegnia diclina VS20]EQC26954.1 hypothetical protein SDRG_15285 [Saprolegnia diclina VS20]|eukprot:XP_008619675.1 hypothetical protein SDRG_15285 [Saprolegnia diclina VS20]
MISSMRTKAHLVLLALHYVAGLTAAPAMTTNVCASPAFAAAPVIAMGRTPASIKVLVQGEYVCFQFNISDDTVQWGSLAIASTPKMVGDTPYNVVILDVAAPPALLYTMKGGGLQDTTVNADQSPINVTQSTHINGVLSFTFQRRLAAVVDSDVAIDPSGVTTLTWSYDTKSFPSDHKASGALQLTLNAAHNVNAPLNTLYTAVIAAGVFGVMLALGIVATYLGRFRLINYTTLCAPPKSDKGLAPLVQILADLKIGEGIIVLLFLGALVGASLYLQTPTPILNYARFAFISGHLSLLSLMFSLIPIARGPHWQHLFGSSHDRVLKFHRASSWLFVLFGLVHLVLYIPATSPVSTQVYGQSAVWPIAAPSFATR